MQTFNSIADLVGRLKEDDPEANQGFEYEYIDWGRSPRIIATGDGLRFLYRGQTRRWQPCQATVWRSNQPSPDARLNWTLSRTRIAEFEGLLEEHPLMALSTQQHVAIDADALAQHYGIPTFWMDLTSSIDVASFFAVAKFNLDGSVSPCADGTGVIYRVPYLQFEEPFRHFVPVSHGAARRPGRQHAWSVGVNDGVDFDSLEWVERFEFQHAREGSLAIINSLKDHLFPADSLASLARTLLDAPAVTMWGIRAALKRDGCPPNEIDRVSLLWGELLCDGLNLDVYMDERFSLTDEQIGAGEADVAAIEPDLLKGVGFRLVRTRKEHS